MFFYNFYMDKWEYKIEKLLSNKKDKAEEILNSFGSEGWELINVNKGGTFTSYTFKRKMR